MYNEEVKSRYIESCRAKQDPDANQKEMTLEALEEQELAIGKEFGEMNREEMIQAIAESSVTYGRLVIRLKFLKDYLRWYDAQVHPVSYGNSNYAWSDIDLTETFKRKLVSSVDQIVSDWSEYPAYNGDYPQPLFILIWHGFDLKQAVKIKDSDVVDCDSHFVINTPSRQVVVDDPSAVRVLRYYQGWQSDQEWTRSKSDTFLYRRIRHGTSDTRKPQAAPNISIRVTRLKEKGNTPDNYMTDRYAANSVKLAGMCYHVIKLEDSGASEQEIIDLEKFYGFYSPQSLRAGMVKKSIECYRKAFNL